MAITLYDFPLSGHAHRARLFISLISVEARFIDVDLAAGEHKSEAFLAKNRFGQVPLLEDGNVTVADSNAILVYLAKKYQRTDWLPEEPEAAAQIQRWLSVAAGQIAYGPAAARLITLFGAKLNAQEVKERAAQVLAVIDAELTERAFIVGETPTIADVALYSYISSAPEGNVDLSPYAAVNKWLTRIEGLPGFTPLAQSPVGLRA